MAISPRTLVQGNAAKVQSLPAPLGGWNARDSFANMDPSDAVTLINMFPTVSNLTLRGGYTKHATGLTGKAQTIMVYNSGNTSKMFAVTSAGDIKLISIKFQKIQRKDTQNRKLDRVFYYNKEKY